MDLHEINMNFSIVELEIMIIDHIAERKKEPVAIFLSATQINYLDDPKRKDPRKVLLEPEDDTRKIDGCTIIYFIGIIPVCYKQTFQRPQTRNQKPRYDDKDVIEQQPFYTEDLSEI